MKIKVRAIIVGRSETTRLPRSNVLTVEQAKVLLIRRVKNGSEYWVFPGGSVEEYDADETSALKRECKEELGVKVKVGNLLFSDSHGDSKQNFYECKIIDGEVGTSKGPEFKKGTDYEGTYNLEWVPMEKISKLNLQPETIKTKLGY